MYYTYILENAQGRLYIGQTNSLEGREHRHNTNQVRSTKNKGPWKIIFSRQFSSRSESMKFESYLKSLKNPKYIKTILTDKN